MPASTGAINGVQSSVPVAALHVVELPRDIARRAAGDCRNRAHSTQIGTVADRAGGHLVALGRGAVHDQGLALPEAARRHIGDEARARVAQDLGLVRLLGRFDDAVADRLGARIGAVDRKEHPALGPGLRHGGGFHDPDPRRDRDRCEVFGGDPDFLVGHRLREILHQTRVGLTRVGRLSRAVAEIDHLLHEVFVGQAGDVGVFRTTLAVGIVTQAAGIDLWLRRLLALGDDVGHRRMVLGEPVGRAIAVGDLRAGERELRSRKGVQLHVVKFLLRIGLSPRRVWRRRRHVAVGPRWRSIVGLYGCGESGRSPEHQGSRSSDQLADDVVLPLAGRSCWVAGTERRSV